MYILLFFLNEVGLFIYELILNDDGHEMTNVVEELYHKANANERGL